MDIKNKNDYSRGLNRNWGFHDNRYIKAATLSTIRTGHFYAPRDNPYHSFLGPNAAGIIKLINNYDMIGIRTPTSRLAARCLNQLGHRV